MTAIGDVDEANCTIGMALADMTDDRLRRELLLVQNDLFDLGADLATPDDVVGALRVSADQVSRLEAAIDRFNSELDSLDSFVLPGGHPVAAALHVARAVTRRAERSAVAAAPSSEQVLIYLNRLSDFLFVAGRYVNKRGGGDVLWIPGATRSSPD